MTLSHTLTDPIIIQLV